MCKGWGTRAVSGFLILALLGGIIPASAATAEADCPLDSPNILTTAAEPVEVEPPDIELLADEAVLPTVSSGNWSFRPGLKVRALAGNGSDPNAEFSLHDMDYLLKKLEQFTLRIELTYYSGHEAPTLIIDTMGANENLYYIGTYTDPSKLNAGTVKADKVGSMTRKLTYSLKPTQSVTTTVELNVTFTPRGAGQPLSEWPILIDFTATDSGNEAREYVDRAASTVTCRDVPKENFLTDAAYLTSDVTVKTTKAKLVSGESKELVFTLFNANLTSAFESYTPEIRSMDLKLTALTDGLKIIGATCDSISAGKKLQVRDEGSGVYVIENYPISYAPNSSRVQYKLTLQLQNESAVYDQVNQIRLTGVTFKGANGREYEQKLPPADRVLAVQTLKAPVPGTFTLKVSAQGTNDYLWFNSNGDTDAGGQKYTSPISGTLSTVFGAEAAGAEQTAYTDLSLEFPLPKALGPGSVLWFSTNTLRIEFYRKGAATWEDATPYLTTSSVTKFQIPAATPSEAPVERIRVTDGRSDNLLTTFMFRYESAWAAPVDRDGASLADGQTETITLTARGKLPDGSEAAAEVPHTITYRSYDAPRAVNCISFTGRTLVGAAYGYWDICTPRGQRRPADQLELADLPCYTGRDWYVSGGIMLTNASTVSNTRPIPQTNMTFELKPGPGAKLVMVDSVNVTSTKIPSNAKAVFADQSAQVVITLASGETLNKTQADLPYTAEEGDSIASARFLFPKQLTDTIPLMKEQQDYSPMFRYGFNLDPDSALAGAGQDTYNYVKLSFLGSAEVPLQEDGSNGSFTVSRSVPVVVSTFASPGPYTFLTRFPAPTSGSAAAGGRVTVKFHPTATATTWTASASAVLERGAPTVHFNQNAETRAMEGVHYVAYRVDKHFTFIKDSQRLADGAPPVEVTWRRGFFDNGDSLLRFDAQDGVPAITEFGLSVNINTAQGTYVPVSKAWLGGDFSGLMEVTSGTYPSDQDSRVQITYTQPAHQSEQDLSLDLDGNGVTGTDTASTVLTEVTSTSGVNVSAVSLEGVLAYGSSQEDFVEGSGPYYGHGDDVFTYRTRIMSISSQQIKSLVCYIPIPRKDKAPTGSAAVNEWDVDLLALEGNVVEKLGAGAGKYQLWYSIKDDPKMQELNGLQDVADTYVSYDPAHPPDWSKVTMLKVKAADLPASTSDDLGFTFRNAGDAEPHALKNHIESYYRYEIDRNDGKGTVTMFGPSSSVQYILPYMSVEGKVYLDRDYSETINLNGFDLPLAGITVALYDASGTKVAEAVTSGDGGFALTPPIEGEYSLRIDPAALGVGETARKLLPLGAGSDVNPATGQSALFSVDRDGVTGKRIGVFEKKGFTLYTDPAYTQPLADVAVVDLSLNGKELVYAKVLPSYAHQTAGVQPTVTLSDTGKVTGTMANNVLTLNGLRVTAADSPVTVTATLDDGAGGTVTHSFQVRVLPPRVVAKFEDNLNFYTDVLYSKDELAGGITLQNQVYEGADLLPGGLQAVAVYRYQADGSIDKSDHLAWGSMDATKTFTEAQIGKFALLYEGVDLYGRKVVDADGNEEILRTVYVHGYPYLDQKTPIQARTGAGYDPMREQDGTAYLTAAHRHAYTDSDGTVAIRADETFTADPTRGDITLLGYWPYEKNGGSFDTATGKFKPIDITDPAERAKLLTSTPTEAGAYEVYYSVHMGTRQAVLTLHRTLYLHGSPSMYVPTVISMAPEEGKDPGSDMSLDYASRKVWGETLLDMRPLDHVRQDGSVVTYDRATTKFYLEGGTEITDDILGTAATTPTGSYVVTAPKKGTYGGQAANVFLKDDSLDVLKNTPGVYEVTVVFQDTIDGMGTAGTPDAWDENWAALYQEGGIGYTEMTVKVLVTSGDAKPVLPSQDQLVTNLVLGDSEWFSRLTDFDDKSIEAVRTAYGDNDANELEDRIASGRVAQLQYETWTRYYQAEPEKTDGAVTGATHFDNKTGENLLYMLNQAVRYKTHDVDIHALKPVPAANGVTEEQYEALHQAAVTLLWKSVKLTELRVYTLGQDADRIISNPSNQDILDLLAEGRPGTLEATFSVNDVTVMADSSTGAGNLGSAAGGADTVSGYGYTVALDRNETVTETYKIYLHSDLKFERPNGAPLVTYGLHIPSAQSHTSMAIDAYYIGAKTLQKMSYHAAASNPDISAAGEYINMDYSYTHPIESSLPTLRERTVHYYGRAFVNGNVELRYEDASSLPDSRYFNLNGPVTVDIIDLFTAQVDRWTGLPADTGLNGVSAEYPAVKGAPRVDGTTAAAGAEYGHDQQASLKVYEGGILLYDSADPGAATTITSQAPGKRVLTYVAEDPGLDDNHPYHNGPNRKSASVSYVFDAPVTISFGSAVEQADSGDYSLKVLTTDTDDQIKEKLAAAATVVYGDDPALAPSTVGTAVDIVRAGDGKPQSATVTAAARNHNVGQAVVALTAQRPPVILIHLVDDHGAAVAADITISGAVIGQPYTVPAPYLEHYALTGDAVKTVDPVREGENELSFTYRPVSAADELADYTILYRLADGTELLKLTARDLVGQEVSHTAPDFYYQAHVRYALSGGETAAKTMTLSGTGENRMEFLYEPAPETVQVQYTVQYLYEDLGGSTAVAETHTMVGTVGEMVQASAPGSFSRDGYQYTLKAGEPTVKSIQLDRNAAVNVISFLYTRALIEIGGGTGGGGGGGGTTTVNYYAVLFISGAYGQLKGEGELQLREGKKVEQVPTVIPEEGYEFLGWYAERKDQLVEPRGQVVKGNLTFYALYRGPDGGQVGGSDPDGSSLTPALNREDHIVFMIGDDLGTFRPDATITRAEVAMMFARLLRYSIPADFFASAAFPDVDPSAWYAQSISYLGQLEILQGYEDGTFRPNRPIARSEFVAIATRFTQMTLTDRQQFSDVPQDYWAAVQINSAKVQGWINGYPDGTFRPDQNITRAEAAKIVNGLLGRSPDHSYIDGHRADLKQFPDLEPSYWAYYDIMETTNAHGHRNADGREVWTALQ